MAGKFADRVERIHDHLVNCIEFANKLDAKKGIPVGDFIRFVEVIADELERAQLDMPLRCEEPRAKHGAAEFTQDRGELGQRRLNYNEASFNFTDIEGT